MPDRGKRRRSLSGGAVVLTLIAVAMGPGAGAASAAGPPVVGSAWTSQVASSTARLSAQVNPNGLTATYHFDYITKAAYDANGGTFAGAARVPPVSDVNIGSGTGAVAVLQILSNLTPDTAYRYRVAAKNSASSPNYVTGPTLSFTTQATGAAPLADSRGWEMVSPVDKNGGQVEAPGAIAAGGVLQAAAQGDSVTYGSSTSFGKDAQGAPPASQYIATRGAGGWSSQNVTVPIFSGSYGTQDEGVPYQLFSPDLARGLLLNGEHCRGGGSGCAVANPPLAGTDAPEGYQDYYLREGDGFTALLGASDVTGLDLAPADFDLSFAGASPDLSHVVLSTCAALTPDATEAASPPGCDANEQNLYEWSSGSGLSLVNNGGTGAALAAQANAISASGARVYWTDLPSGDLYLHESAASHLVDTAASFQTASTDGSVAFYTKSGDLWRYVDGASATKIATGVLGVLGASDTGDFVYYQDGAGLQVWHSGGGTSQVAPNAIAPPADAADSSDYPPTTGTARVSADGTRLLFVSSASLTGYDNTDLGSGNPDSQVYLYDATGAGTLTCVSCNPTNERPLGSSTIPGAVANGTASGSTDTYKPRALSADGKRVFFDSRDALALSDTNNDADVYEWEAQGEGSCTRSGGCVALISSGRGTDGASFVDASADGSDAFFLTDESLVGADPGAVDLYDARIDGGFPEPSTPIVCEGDNCQSLPPAPTDPTLTTLQPGLGNPPVNYHNLSSKKAKKKKHHKKHKAKHHKRHHKLRRHYRGRGR